MKKIVCLFSIVFLSAGLFSCSGERAKNISGTVLQAVNAYIANRATAPAQVVWSNEKLLLISKSEIKDKKIIITQNNGTVSEYKIRGVCYAPDTDGELYFQDYKEDMPLIKTLNANSIRTYRPLGASAADGSFSHANTIAILDECLREGLTVAVGFSYDDMADGGAMEEYLRMFGTHPAILMIVLGNEYNYHYDEWFSKNEWFSRISSAIKIIKKYSPNRIIATVHGELPSQDEYNEYVNAGINLIMMNLYRGSNFGFAQENWYKLTNSMPWVVSEFGRSSKDASGKDTSKIQTSYLQTLIRALDQGYLFTLVDDPAKGSDEISPSIGAEDSMGVYDKNRTPKIAAEAVREEYRAKEKAGNGR
ncbi:hypothetical protein [Endomicrobium proavitum]|uniref:Uncharacterized protein n=1 Tax=Endomicrobium proavitum TaxID=1408281 RepID=A0A0G3WKV6_9BACT|nr:hypothetical protein [Endomicrobium proavitum]AKL98505.1 exported protein of unknown function [Endomicrobium proavitum]